ncbi:MAG: hypothetical protein ACI4QL_03340, partial [Candidatus Fimimonas sp.]
MMDLRTIHVALLAWGSIFSLISAVCLCLNRSFSGKKRLWMIGMLLACTFLLASDSFAYAFKGNVGTEAAWIVRLSNFLVFLLSDVILYLFHGYICSCLFNNTKPTDAFTQFCIKTVYAIAVLGMSLVVVSQFTGLYYTIDANNVYQRTNLFFISLIPPAVGMIIDFVLIVKYHKNVSKDIFVSLLLYIVLPLTAEIVQAFVYGISLINISICISVII